MLLSLLCFPLLDGMPGLLCRIDWRFVDVPEGTELDVDAHISAAFARVSKFFSDVGPEALDARHLHFQTLLQRQGFSSEATTKLVR
jgi:hypothetical protein